jgi:hypothetical protein
VETKGQNRYQPTVAEGIPDGGVLNREMVKAGLLLVVQTLFKGCHIGWARISGLHVIQRYRGNSEGMVDRLLTGRVKAGRTAFHENIKRMPFPGI